MNNEFIKEKDKIVVMTEDGMVQRQVNEDVLKLENEIEGIEKTLKYSKEQAGEYSRANLLGKIIEFFSRDLELIIGGLIGTILFKEFISFDMLYIIAIMILGHNCYALIKGHPVINYFKGIKVREKLELMINYLNELLDVRLKELNEAKAREFVPSSYQNSGVRSLTSFNRISKWRSRTSY